MRLNRRNFATGTAALTVGATVLGISGFVLDARAAVDNDELMKPGPWAKCLSDRKTRR